MAEAKLSVTYETKNVDAYNKWYNTKGKELIRQREEEQDCVCHIIFGTIGFIVAIIAIVTIVKLIKRKISNRPKKEKPRVEEKRVEVISTIKKK